MLARDEVPITGRNCLIVIPDHDWVGGGFGRACAVPWLPAGRVWVRQLCVGPVESLILDL